MRSCVSRTGFWRSAWSTFARTDGSLQGFAVVVRDPEVHFRKAGLDPREQGTDQDRRHRGRQTDLDRTLRHAFSGTNQHRELIEVVQDRGSLAIQQFAFRRRACPASTALKQRNAQPFLQLVNLLAQRGLGHVDQSRCTRKTAGFHNLHEIAELSKLHDPLYLAGTSSDRLSGKNISSTTSSMKIPRHHRMAASRNAHAA